MTDSEIIPADAEDIIVKMFKATTEELESAMDIDLVAMRDNGAIDKAKAMEIVKNMAYNLMYVVKDHKGLPASKEEAHGFILFHYPWLLEIGGYKAYSTTTTLRHADGRYKEIWEETFDSRRKLAGERFRDRIKEVDLMLPALLRAIMDGDLDLIPTYVALAKLDATNVGYQAATRYEISAGGDDDVITEGEKAKAAQALDEVREYERLLMEEKAPQIIEGEYETEIEPEKLKEIVEQSAQTAKDALDEAVGRVLDDIDGPEEEE